MRPAREPCLRCPGEGTLPHDGFTGCLSDHDYLSPYRTVRHGESAGTQAGGTGARLTDARLVIRHMVLS
jgi:hypothetical protein